MRWVQDLKNHLRVVFLFIFLYSFSMPILSIQQTHKLLFSLISILLSMPANAHQIFQKLEFMSGDVKLESRIFGKGKPLIIINGGPGRSSDSFMKFGEALSSSTRQVILFDQRGTGKSRIKEMNEKNITLDLMVEDLEALRRKLGHDKISLLGHSFGGMYAMAYAAKYYKHLDRLILSASGSIRIKSMKSVDENIRRKLTKDELRNYSFWTSLEQKKKDALKAKLKTLELTARLYVKNQDYVPTVKENLTNLEYYNLKTNVLVWQSMKNFDLSDKFKKFEVPTLVIAGADDFIGHEIPIEVHRAIQSSELLILKNCSHYPWLDNPKDYFSAINKFLAEK